MTKFIVGFVVALSAFVCGCIVGDHYSMPEQCNCDFNELCEPSIRSVENELHLCYAAQDKIYEACEAYEMLKNFGSEDE